MFRCQLCSCVVAPRTPAHRVVLEQRKRQYRQREKANLFWRHRKDHKREDPGGSGFEIVREVLVCPTCARRHQTSAPAPPDQRAGLGPLPASPRPQVVRSA